MSSTVARNSYIQQCYLRKDFVGCLRAIEDQLTNCDGKNEFALNIKGLILRHQGRIEESLACFKLALCINPTKIENVKQVAKSLYLMGKHKAALDLLAEIESMNVEDRDVHHTKGLCYVYLKQYEKAIESFETANSIQRHEKTYSQLGQLYRSLRRNNEAIEAYVELLELSPECPDTLTTIGLLYLKNNDHSKAFEYFGNSLTYDPRNSKSILAAASIIQDHRDVDVALIKYRTAAIQIPDNPQLWNNVGMCFFGKQKYIAAISCLKRAIYLAPLEWLIYYNLGVIYMNTEQFASAHHYLSACINLNPNFAKAHGYLAMVLTRLQDFDRACATYEKSLQLEEDYTTLLNYAITLYHNREIERATVQFMRFDKVLQAHILKYGATEIDYEVTQQSEIMHSLLNVTN